MCYNKDMNIKEYLYEKRKERYSDRHASDRYERFFHNNAQELEELFTYYTCAMMEVETKFKVLNAQLSLNRDYSPIETIKSRVKTMESLIEKVERYDIPLEIPAIIEQVTDIAGIRIICSFPEDIYSLADMFLQQDDVRLVERKDYFKNPKPNGYRSLHLIVTVPIFLEHEKRDMNVEVQFRTIAMDFWASLEHKLKYKKNLPPDISDRLVAELLECAEASAELDLKMQNIRAQINGSISPIDDEIDLHQWF